MIWAIAIGGIALAVLACVYVNRSTRQRCFREEAASLNYEEAGDRFSACVEYVVAQMRDPLHSGIRFKDAERALDRAVFYRERMIEFEHGKSGPQVRLAIRRHLLPMCRRHAEYPAEHPPR